LCAGNWLRANTDCDTNKGHHLLQGKGRFINRPTKTGKRVYDKFFVYIPTEIARDGLFPFHDGDEISIRVDGKQKRVIIEKSA
jgi:hypothetical protein